MTIIEKNDKAALFDAIDKGKTEKALELLASVETAQERDPTGMTPLAAAAYRGNVAVSKRCFELESDVNSKTDDSGYTPLMFAALSGNAEMCKFLMDKGARMYLTNSIGKTASELAAFIGHHECVSVINNHVSIDEVESFLRPKSEDGEEPEEVYPDELATFVHSLCSTHEIHPVHLIFQLSNYPETMRYKKKILYVVDRIFEKQLRSKESNEVMSLKLWIILFTLREVFKFVESTPDRTPEDAALLFAKGLLAWTATEEIRKPVDVFLRNCVIAFPYKHSLLYETLSKSMGQTPVAFRPSAFDYIIQGLFGQRILAVSQFCSVCGAVAAKKRCSACKLTYCSQYCQKFDWAIHKGICRWVKTLHDNDMGTDNDSIIMDDIQAHLNNIDI